MAASVIFELFSQTGDRSEGEVRWRGAAVGAPMASAVGNATLMLSVNWKFDGISNPLATEVRVLTPCCGEAFSILPRLGVLIRYCSSCEKECPGFHRGTLFVLDGGPGSPVVDGRYDRLQLLLESWLESSGQTSLDAIVNASELRQLVEDFFADEARIAKAVGEVCDVYGE